jgi:hypothetical protein
MWPQAGWPSSPQLWTECSSVTMMHSCPQHCTSGCWLRWRLWSAHAQPQGLSRTCIRAAMGKSSTSCIRRCIACASAMMVPATPCNPSRVTQRSQACPMDYGSQEMHHQAAAAQQHSSTEVSKRFAWLPTDVQLTTGAAERAEYSFSLAKSDCSGSNSSSSNPGVRARFISYINGLHPSVDPEAALYPLLEELVSRFVSMWDMVLGHATGAITKGEDDRQRDDHDRRHKYSRIQSHSYGRVFELYPEPVVPQIGQAGGVEPSVSTDEEAWRALEAAEAAQLLREADQQPQQSLVGEPEVASAATIQSRKSQLHLTRRPHSSSSMQNAAT